MTRPTPDGSAFSIKYRTYYETSSYSVLQNNYNIVTIVINDNICCSYYIITDDNMGSSTMPPPPSPASMDDDSGDVWEPNKENADSSVPRLRLVPFEILTGGNPGFDFRGPNLYHYQNKVQKKKKKKKKINPLRLWLVKSHVQKKRMEN